MDDYRGSSKSSFGSGGSSSENTASGTMESGVRKPQQEGNGCFNDGFEVNDDLSPSPLSPSSPRTPPWKALSTTVNMELAEFSSGKISSRMEGLNPTGNPNGEYFISINEDKKVSIHEKNLKESRPNCGRFVGVDKCYGWSIGIIFIIVVVIVTIGALVGVGIFNPKPERFLGQSGDIFSEEDSRFGISVRNGSTDQDEETESFPGGFVPNVYNGLFKINNLAWNPKLSDTSSQMYKELSSKVKSALEETLLSNDLTNSTRFYISIGDFQPGSVVVNFRFGWIRKNIVSRNESLEWNDRNKTTISREYLLEKFANALKASNGKIGTVYAIDPSSPAFNFVLNRCHEMKCDVKCQYSYEQSDFFCTCPENFFLGLDNMSCVEGEKIDIFPGTSTTKKSTDYHLSENDQQAIKVEDPAGEILYTTIDSEPQRDSHNQDQGSSQGVGLEVDPTTSAITSHSNQYLTTVPSGIDKVNPSTDSVGLETTERHPNISYDPQSVEPVTNVVENVRSNPKEMIASERPVDEVSKSTLPMAFSVESHTISSGPDIEGRLEEIEHNKTRFLSTTPVIEASGEVEVPVADSEDNVTAQIEPRENDPETGREITAASIPSSKLNHKLENSSGFENEGDSSLSNQVGESSSSTHGNDQANNDPSLKVESESPDSIIPSTSTFEDLEDKKRILDVFENLSDNNNPSSPSTIERAFFVSLICEQDQFQCGNGSCISKYHRCDQIQHCIDGSDEEGCDSYLTSSSPMTGSSPGPGPG